MQKGNQDPCELPQGQAGELDGQGLAGEEAQDFPEDDFSQAQVQEVNGQDLAGEEVQGVPLGVVGTSSCENDMRLQRLAGQGAQLRGLAKAGEENQELRRRALSLLPGEARLLGEIMGEEEAQVDSDFWTLMGDLSPDTIWQNSFVENDAVPPDLAKELNELVLELRKKTGLAPTVGEVGAAYLEFCREKNARGE